MQGDFSRVTFRREKHYVGVNLEQGRVISDATLNEEQSIRQYHEETANRDVIGASGAPRESAGFALSTTVGGDLVIGAGRYYVDGILVENDQENMPLSDQIGAQPDIRSLLQEAGANLGLAYLEVWQRHISALHDDHIREKALGGPDDSSRVQTWWRVNVLPLASVSTDKIEAELQDLLDQRRALQSERNRVRNAARRRELLTALGQLNEQIGDLLASSGIRCDGNFEELDALIGIGSGRMIADAVESAGDEGPCSLPAEGGFQGMENQLYRVQIHSGGTRSQARFVYSRENASVIERITDTNGSEITLQSLGRDLNLGFGDDSRYDFVEIFNDETEARGEPGQLLRVLQVHAEDNVLELSAAPSVSTDPTLNPKVRRWDQTSDQAGNSGLMRLNSANIELEKGIQVEFSSGRYRAGDYWVIPARTAPVSDVEWVPAGMHPPHGVQHHFASLAFVYADGNREAPVVLTDCRNIFPPLTAITADDVSFDDSHCELGADTVQEALDALCRSQAGLCTVTLGPNSDIDAALSAIGDGEDAQICFQLGAYTLNQPIRLEGKGHINIIGAGYGTRLIATGLEHVFVCVDCESVSIRDLHAQTSATNVGDELGGTLEFHNCGAVTVEKTSLQCGHGAGRRASCIKVQNSGNRVSLETGTARIRGNTLHVGHLQSGMILVNVPRAQVEDNMLQTYAKPAVFGLRSLAIARNVEYMSPIINTLLMNVIAIESAPSDKTTTTRPRRKPGRVVVSGAIEAAGDLTERVALDRLAAKQIDLRVPLSEKVGLRIISPDPVISSKDWIAAIRDENISFDDFTLAEESGVRQVVRDVAVNILANQGRVGRTTNNWRTWFDRAVNDDQAVMGQGIVIGGEVADDVRILNNTVQTCIQGIHVGLSRRNSSANLQSQTVIIANNSIKVSMPTAATRERHGIFVGNSESCVIENNYLTADRFNTTAQLTLEAVRVWGVWGERIYVRGNHVHNQGSDSFTNGVRMNPLNGLDAKRWLVADNIAGVRVTGDFIKEVIVKDNAG